MASIFDAPMVCNLNNNKILQLLDKERTIPMQRWGGEFSCIIVSRFHTTMLHWILPISCIHTKGEVGVVSISIPFNLSWWIGWVGVLIIKV